MSKFVIECPKCRKYVEASSGLFGTGMFAKRRIKCSCGETINIQTEKLSSRKCPHCGNDVVFDQWRSRIRRLSSLAVNVALGFVRQKVQINSLALCVIM